MTVYEDASLYIESAASIQEKILAIDAIIAALMLTAAKGAGTGNISEYSLDDGQTKIRTAYRDMSDVFKSINAFERLKQQYINQSTGRVTRLIDIKNITG